MLQPPARQKHPLLDQLVHDRAIGGAELARLLALGFEHREARKQRHMRIIASVRIHRIGDVAMARGDPDGVVVGAVAGRGMNKARTGVVSDVVARQQGHVELIALAAQGMGAGEPARIDIADALPRRDLGGARDIGGQFVGDDQPVARRGPGRKSQALFDGFDLVQSIGDLRAVGDGAVCRQGPGRGGPDDDRGAHKIGRSLRHGKLHPDGRAGVVVILDLGVGQGRALDRAPHHGLGAAIELAAHQEFVELLHDGGFGTIVHGGVALFPVAQHAQPLEFIPLLVDPAGGVDAAGGAELGLGDLALGPALGAEFFLDLPFDRQAMAVPARHVIHVIAQHEPGADHEVLEDLVQGMADMDRAIGVRGAIMQHEQGPAIGLTFRADGVIKIRLLPARQELGLELGQARPHGEGRLRQEDSVAVVALGGGRRVQVIGHGKA